MAVDLASLIDPADTAVVTSELQKGVVGDESALPELAAAVRPAVEAAGRLARGARAAGVQVVHGTVHQRPDFKGSNTNGRLFLGVRRSPVRFLAGTPAVEVVDEVGVEAEDIVLTRTHGLSPMAGTDLDPVLRNLRVRALVIVGVSVNVAITNLVMDAVNLGYEVVLPRDAVGGIPGDYAAAMIDNTLSLIATVTTVDEILNIWSGG